MDNKHTHFLAKNIVISGATSGIGLHAIQALIQNDTQLFMLARNYTKAQTVKNTLLAKCPKANIYIIECDYNSLASVHAASQKILDKGIAIDLLINNAGTAEVAYSLSQEGIEKTFMCNHLAHFVMTLNILPLLKKAHSARIINTSSVIHYKAKDNFLRDINFNHQRYFVLTAYANSKFANVLFTKKCQREFPSHIQSYCFHPGHVATSIWPQKRWYSYLAYQFLKKFIFISPQQGAKPLIYLAREIQVDLNGKDFLHRMQPRFAKRSSNKQQLQDELWENSLALSAGSIIAS